MATAKAEAAQSRLTTSLSGCSSGMRLEYLFFSAPCVRNRMDSLTGVKAEVILREITPKVCRSHLLEEIPGHVPSIAFKEALSPFSKKIPKEKNNNKNRKRCFQRQAGTLSMSLSHLWVGWGRGIVQLAPNLQWAFVFRAAELVWDQNAEKAPMICLAIFFY